MSDNTSTKVLQEAVNILKALTEGMKQLDQVQISLGIKPLPNTYAIEVPVQYTKDATVTFASIGQLRAAGLFVEEQLKPLVDKLTANTYGRRFFFPLVMPLDVDGRGPASIENGEARKLTWEVWDHVLNSYGSYDYLWQAIAEAEKMNQLFGTNYIMAMQFNDNVQPVAYTWDDENGYTHIEPTKSPSDNLMGAKIPVHAIPLYAKPNPSDAAELHNKAIRRAIEIVQKAFVEDSPIGATIVNALEKELL